MTILEKSYHNSAIEVTSSLFDKFEPTRRRGPKIHLKEPFSRTDLLKRLPAAAVPSIWNGLCPNMYYTDGSNKQEMIK